VKEIAHAKAIVSDGFTRDPTRRLMRQLLAEITGQNWLAPRDDVRPMAEALQEDENWAVSWMVTPDLFTGVADAGCQATA
jgi:hypothetical protein